MASRTLRVDPEVWQRLVERQALLAVRAGRQVTMNETVRDLLAEAWAQEALAPRPEPGNEDEEGKDAG